MANYLKKVTVNGLALENNVNCRVSIYLQGAIVMPHSDTKNADKTDFYPLTVYTGDNCTGESYQYNGDSRRTTGPWVNTMRSFTLKRGYMLTVANMSDGTGYSHCYIANHNDITVQLRTELAGKVGFFRIFRWQWPGKKGSCDVGPTNLNATWHYNWGQEPLRTLTMNMYHSVTMRQEPPMVKVGREHGNHGQPLMPATELAPMCSVRTNRTTPAEQVRYIPT